ncbi:MAG TPA: hypothetical protein ENG01_00190 [Candidatus Aenigmarchaeota archaeon]|nr:MAG: hypothetical protein DRN75_04165 [Nanoarchaeota archaeon]HDO79768.1 hypothetical protein [Candidatus Aenigmarchaeota archaeon]HEX32820.1 hypothetical protein [Candidatus Aenigmarchaeota archaeon]
MKGIGVLIVLGIAALLVGGTILGYTVVYPKMKVRSIEQKEFKHNLTEREQYYIEKGNELYMGLANAKDEINNDPKAREALEKIGNMSLKVYVLSNGEKIWSMYVEVQDGKIVSVEQYSDKKADCTVTTEAVVLDELMQNKDVKALLNYLLKGDITVSPASCYSRINELLTELS